MAPKKPSKASAESPSLSDLKPGFAHDLINWYEKNGRDLPWRNTSEPYHIWLSEVMLQQTQVVTVIDYYHNFLKRFPTLADLANAPLADVLKAWEGLGYYARGRNLHQAAKMVMAEYGGNFPDTLEAVEGLPGIGKSTAGAILTFAKGQRHPILDGNVKRVWARLFNVSESLSQPAVLKRLWAISESLLSQTDPETSEPYAFNQAIMELGATVCTPKDPKCLLCPVKPYCDSAEAGVQHERPLKEKKKATPHYHIGAAVIWKGDKVLIQQRPAKGLLGGLWEFPGGKQEPGETIEETVRREIQEELCLKVKVGEKVATVKHAYTHFRITLHAFHCEYTAGKLVLKSADDHRWLHPDDLTQYAFPKANNRVIDAIQEQMKSQLREAQGRLPEETLVLS